MDKLSGGELTYDKTVSTCYETFAAHGTYGFIAELVTLEDYPGVCSGAFGLAVDPDREIAEANEDNNGFEKSFFAREWGGNWRAIHPAEVRIGKANLLPLQDGGTGVLPFEDVNVSVPLRNCCSKGMNHQVIFRFAGSEIARFNSVYLSSGASKALLFAIHVPRTPEFKSLEIFVLNEIDSQMVAGKVPDFKAQVRVD